MSLRTRRLCLATISFLSPVAHAQCGSIVWSRVGDAPYRAGHALAYDSFRGRIIMFGGTVLFTGQQFGNDTLEYKDGHWTKLFPATLPPGRTEKANLSYDSARDRVVLYGGFTFPTLFDTWEFDGTNWSQRASDGPRVTDGFATVYDSARHKVVLFGGQPELFTDPLSDQTWLWDGAAWTMATPATRPPGLRYASMAYDSDRQRVVLFGGRRTDLSHSNETWEWDGTNWTLASTTGPTGGDSNPMAYDSVRHKTVLAYRALPAAFTTWEWDGTTWSLSPQPSFNICGPGLTGNAMVFDAAEAQCILTTTSSQQSTLTNRFGPLTTPPFTLQPIGGVVPPGGQINLSVDTACVDNRTYRWRHNGVPLTDLTLPGGIGGVFGSAGPGLSIYGQALTNARSGTYDCVVTTSCGSLTSDAATIDVTCDPSVVTYEIDPAVCRFILSAFDGTELASAVATLLGSMTVAFDPSCGSDPVGTRAQITDIDWHTSESSVPMTWAGGTATLNNLHCVLNDTRGMRPESTLISNASFEQTAQIAFDGTLVYNAFTLSNTLDLTTAPPLTVVATTGIGGSQTPSLTIPFDDDYEVDAGLGALNPRLRMITTIHAVEASPTCVADVDDGSGTGAPDQAVTIDDLLYYLVLFQAGSIGADVDDGSGTNTHDNAVTIDDLLYFLSRFSDGC